MTKIFTDEVYHKNSRGCAVPKFNVFNLVLKSSNVGESSWGPHLKH